MYPLLLRFNNSNYGRSKNFIFILFLRLLVGCRLFENWPSLGLLKQKKHKTHGTRPTALKRHGRARPVALMLCSAYKFSRNSSSFGSSSSLDLGPSLRHYYLDFVLLFRSSPHERFCLVCSFGPTGPGPGPGRLDWQ